MRITIRPTPARTSTPHRSLGERGLRTHLALLLRALTAAAVVALALSAAVSPASAATAGPAWQIRSVALPSSFSRVVSEGCKPLQRVACDAYVVTVTNVGSVPSSGGLVVRDMLPPGVVVAEAYGEGCGGAVGGSMVECVFGGSVAAGASVAFGIEVRVTTSAVSSVTNFAEVQGGGAAPAVTAAPSTVAQILNGEVPTFGVQDFAAGVFGADGLADSLAADHPSNVSTTVDYTTVLNSARFRSEVGYLPVQEPKTEVVDLPAGFVGDPRAAETCTQALLRSTEEIPGRCPAGSVVGKAAIEHGGRFYQGTAQIFNIPPEGHEPALFGFEFKGEIYYLRPRLLPSAQGYVLSVSVPDVDRSQTVKIPGVTITFFGDPSEHDGTGNGLALFTNPSSCSAAPASARLEMDSWVDPTRWVGAETPFFQASPTQELTGCGGLSFEPSLEVTPEQATADTPSGYEVDLKVPQAPDTMGIPATPDLKDAMITLPAGVSVSPSAANGLVACQTSGSEGIELGSNDTLAADQLASEHGVRIGGMVQEGEVMGEDGLVHPSRGHCPLASQIGEVEVITPLLEQPLKGHLYVAEPECGSTGQEPCMQADASNGRLFGTYLEVAGAGVIVKLRGKVSVNPETGRVTTSFDENPQLPFSELKLKLNGGSRAPLANPQTCGSSTTISDLIPWSSPSTPDATPAWPLTIGAGCGGGFSPAFTAGTVSPAAGAYSPFTLSFSRNDGEQDLSGLTVNMPEGLLGKIAGFAECGEAEVKAAESNTGGCPSASRVGTATAGAGAGSTPFYQSGPVYLTGPYNGAPFGLAVVVPANAGPYHLGNVVVRAAIHINPSTAQVTVVSNPLPQMIDGVPLRVKTVNVTVGEGENFTFNPTNCNQQSIAATIVSARGATANVSSPFQAQGCANLPFKPVFSASTVGKASKASGASLDVKIASGAGQANIAKVDLQLPKQLPARLTTLQKACTEAQFDTNPAGCPVASNIGTAMVRTPLLNSPLAGPLYLVSHGGAAFPDVEIILQGEGVQLVVDGKTQIKKAITYSHFETVPDAPFSTFETKLPTGKYSIFGTDLPEKDKYNLCGQALSMPVVITGQNGAVLKQTTKIGVTGCPKAKKVTKKKKTKAKRATKSTRRGK
jgi:hypothetical protein